MTKRAMRSSVLWSRSNGAWPGDGGNLVTKTLIQAHRRLRAPILFGLFEKLHAVGRGRKVTVLGGMVAPKRLYALARAGERLALSTACATSEGEHVASASGG